MSGLPVPQSNNLCGNRVEAYLAGMIITLFIYVNGGQVVGFLTMQFGAPPERLFLIIQKLRAVASMLLTQWKRGESMTVGNAASLVPLPAKEREQYDCQTAKTQTKNSNRQSDAADGR